jgi:SAM-dependent methyltransferase
MASCEAVRQHGRVAVHPSATGFNAGADDYERGRPSYPPEAIAWLVEALKIGPNSTVVDLAAGTGKLTRQLELTGAEVIAVEPIAGMRHKLKALSPGVTVYDGTAEGMPLTEGSADAVTVGQAFHWFRGDEALMEVRRVLRRSGRLGLVWNRRDLTQPIQLELHEVINRYRGDTPAFMSGTWRQALEKTEFFTQLTAAQFPFQQVLDADGLVARVLSTSFIAKLSGTDRERVVNDVEEIAERNGDPVVLQYVADCYWCQASDCQYSSNWPMTPESRQGSGHDSC